MRCTGELGYDRLIGTRKKLVRHMQNPSYTYDKYLICIGLVPSILSVICKNLSYSGPSYPSSPVLPFYGSDLQLKSYKLLLNIKEMRILHYAREKLHHNLHTELKNMKTSCASLHPIKAMPFWIKWLNADLNIKFLENLPISSEKQNENACSCMADDRRVLPVFWTGSFLKTSFLDRQGFL